MHAPLSVLLLAAVPALATARAPLPAAPAAPVPCDEAYLGVYLLDAPEGGALVSRVADGSPAAQAGIRAGDRVVAVAGEDLAGADALVAAIEARDAGETVEVSVARGEEVLALAVVLGRRADRPAGAVWTTEPALEGLPDVQAPPVVALVPPATATPFSPLPLLSSVLSAADPGATEPPSDLEARLDEMRRQTERRFEELERRLAEMHEGAGDVERLERLQRELERDRVERERRFQDLRESIRRTLEERRGRTLAERAARRADERRREVEARREERREAESDRAEDRRTTDRRRASEEEERAAEPVSHADLQALRDEVSALREEIRALRDLLEVR